MQSRRAFLSVAGPAVFTAAAAKRGYDFAEIERMLARGDVKGRIARADLPTPALILELEAFENNIAKMTSYAKRQGRALRPHAKTHKCPEIARALIRAGAAGACAAKISEAEALAGGGVTGILLTSAMIGPSRIERAVRLARARPETIFSVDNPQNVQDLDDAAREARIRMRLAVDLYVGRRTGIQPGEPAVALVQHISKQRNVEFAGLQAYAGHASHTNGFENRRRVSQDAMGQAVETRRLLEKSGIECPLVTGGSTGTYNIDANIDGVTELQPGSFIFMDTDYNRIGGEDGPIYRDFRNALFVISTVISKPTDTVAIVDAGYKALATDRPFVPQLRSNPDVPYSWAGDEHGSLNLSTSGAAFRVGDRVEIVAPHCDPTVNLYDVIYGVRGDSLECAWKIAARGKSQ